MYEKIDKYRLSIAIMLLGPSKLKFLNKYTLKNIINKHLGNSFVKDASQKCKLDLINFEKELEIYSWLN